MKKRVDSNAKTHESGASPWPSGVGARRVSVLTPGLGLSLMLIAAGLLWYGGLPAEPGRDLPPHAWARIVTPGRFIGWLAYASDGARLVSADYLDGAIQTWDAASGRSIASIESGLSQVPIFAFALAPGGQTAAVWHMRQGLGRADLATGELMLRLPQTSWHAIALAYAPGGRTLVTAGSDRMIRLYDTATWQQRWSWPVPEAETRCLAVSPDGRSLIGGGTDGRLRCWDLGSGLLLATLHAHDVGADAHDVGATSVACAPDGRTLASGNWDGQIRLWDTATFRERLHLDQRGHGPILSTAFSPDGLLLATGHSDHVVRLWDPATGQLLRSLPGHRHPVRSLAFAPHQRALASAAGTTILLWDLADLPAE